MEKSLMMAVLIVGCAPEPAEPTRLDGGIENADTGQSQTDAGLEVDAGAAPDVGTTPTERTIWAGPRLTFTKANFADPNTPEAQDRITDSVILTRGSRNILYNIVNISKLPIDHIIDIHLCHQIIIDSYVSVGSIAQNTLVLKKFCFSII